VFQLFQRPTYPLLRDRSDVVRKKVPVKSIAKNVPHYARSFLSYIKMFVCCFFLRATILRFTKKIVLLQD
ncbi:MAG: hypothetical protein ACI392_03450, partial [Paludibacteraceae bacterium]